MKKVRKNGREAAICDATVSIMLVAAVASHVTRTTLSLLPRQVLLMTVSALVRCRPELLRLFS